MQTKQKDTLIRKTKAHMEQIRAKITEAIFAKEKKQSGMKKDLAWMTIGDQIAEHTLLAYNKQQLENLKQLYPSPYFARCLLTINGEQKNMFFAKFSFGEEGIYSWITPAATLRFQKTGLASYVGPRGHVQSGIIREKDQYMIVDGKLIFFTIEEINKPRELIYQENFTRHKTGFVLPEVVEQMEQAQDQAIRADFRGPFVISGPAGSGKTTLALHRVAYLMQSPETMEFFEPHTILILVQDSGTKKYFSHLLPELGIKGVEIVTFTEWAVAVLDLSGYTVVTRYGKNEAEKNLYEYSKLNALKNLPNEKYDKNICTMLRKIYSPHLNETQTKLFKEQKYAKLLDRFDLTILLHYYFDTHSEFKIKKEYFEELGNGSYKKVKREFPLRYNLMIVDEFQNYLPEQIKLLQTCANKRINSLVYVGDLAQQTQLGTVRDLPPTLAGEVKKIQKDLLYVALTRAMSELHVLGRKNLHECIRVLF